MKDIIQDQIILTLEEWRQIHPSMPPSWKQLKGMVSNELENTDVSGSQFARAMANLLRKGSIYERKAHFYLTSCGVTNAISIKKEGEWLRFQQVSTQLNHTGEQIGHIFLFFIVAAISIISIHLLTSSGLEHIETKNSDPASGLHPSDKVEELTDFIPLDLNNATQIDGSSLDKLVVDDLFVISPVRSVKDVLGFIPLEPGIRVIETRCEQSINPPVVVIGFRPEKVTRIHLLINLSYSDQYYLQGLNLEGEEITRLRLVSDEDDYIWTLRAGQDLRDWVAGADNVVNTISAFVQPAWEGRHYSSNHYAVIDYEVLSVPPEFKQQESGFLVIEDLSMERFGNINPGIIVWGITLEVLRD